MVVIVGHVLSAGVSSVESPGQVTTCYVFATRATTVQAGPVTSVPTSESTTTVNSFTVNGVVWRLWCLVGFVTVVAVQFSWGMNGLGWLIAGVSGGMNVG